MLPSPAAMTNSERNPTRPLFFHQSHGEPASKERVLGEERVDTQIVVHSLIHAVVQHLFENHCVHHEPAILHRPATFDCPSRSYTLEQSASIASINAGSLW